MEFLTDALGPLGPIILIGFLGVVMVLLVIIMMMKQKQDPLERLKESNRGTDSTQQQRLRAGAKNKKLDKYATFLEPQDEKQLSQIRLTLMQAGYRHRDAVRYFHFAQMTLAVLLLIVGVIYYLVFKSGDDSTPKDALIWILGPGLVGYMLPKYWVTKRKEQRQQEIVEGFPDSLDMMLVCVEAGQSMDQAIIRVSKEMRVSYPALSEEYEIVAHQVKAGRDKPGVLAELSERCGVQDITSFTTVLTQSQTFGTSIADALRVYAGEMRDKRVMRAEEKAARLPAIMTVPLILFILPCLFVVILGPAACAISDALLSSDGGAFT
jgi:tight adherence protein C